MLFLAEVIEFFEILKIQEITVHVRTLNAISQKYTVFGFLKSIFSYVFEKYH